MTLTKKQTGTLLSLFIIAVWTGLVFLLGYPSHNAPTDDFGVVIFCIITLFFGLAIGVIALAVRLFKLIKDKSNFYYIFVGTLDVCLGILGLTLAVLNRLDRPWIYLFAISFIIGLFITIDVYIGKRQVSA